MDWTRDLQRGDRGDDVLAAKNRLFALGYYSEKIKAITNNRFGSDTVNAVKAFQAAAALSVTAIINEATWDALFGDVPPTPPTPSEKTEIAAYDAWHYIGQPYVWSASGVENPTDEYITSHDDENPSASIKYIATKRTKGVTNFITFDCSGFVCYLFRRAGAMTGRTNANGLYLRSSEVAKDDLTAGDLVFRGTDAKKTHVGIYCGDGWVIHAKGRAYGVVAEPIDYKSGYWQYFARFQE